MGVSISQMGCEFFLPAEHKEAAFRAAKPVYGGWVRKGDSKGCTSLSEVLELWGYASEEDEQGNIVKLWFETEKLGEEIKVFQAIGPFVKAGSYLDMNGDYGQFRWAFDGKTCKEQQAKIQWDDDDEED